MSFELPASVSAWTFLSNHSHVLVCIAGDPDIKMREVASQVGITERAVQRIVSELEHSGVVVKTRVGRQNHYQVNHDLPMRHTLEKGRTIGDLLQAIRGRAETA